jgi:hypothetical protein
MRILEANRQRVQNLNGGEIWLFIIARVLIGFALGIFAMIYFPKLTPSLAWPALLVGILLFAIASKGLLRKRRGGPTS